MATEWLTLTDAASRLGVSVRTMQRRIAAGEMDTRHEDGRRLVAVVTPDNGPTRRDNDGGQDGHDDAVVERSMQLAAAVSASADRVRVLAERRADELRADLVRTRRTAWTGWTAAALLGIGGAGVAVWGTDRLATATTERDTLADTVQRADATRMASEAREAVLTRQLSRMTDDLAEARQAAEAASEWARAEAATRQKLEQWRPPMATPDGVLAGVPE